MQSIRYRGPLAGLLLAAGYGYGAWLLAGWATYMPHENLRAPLSVRGADGTFYGYHYPMTSYHADRVAITIACALFIAGVWMFTAYLLSTDKPFVVRHGVDDRYPLFGKCVSIVGVSAGLLWALNNNATGAPAWNQGNLAMILWCAYALWFCICQGAHLDMFSDYECHDEEIPDLPMRQAPVPFSELSVDDLLSRKQALDEEIAQVQRELFRRQYLLSQHQASIESSLGSITPRTLLALCKAKALQRLSAKVQGSGSASDYE